MPFAVQAYEICHILKAWKCLNTFPNNSPCGSEITSKHLRSLSYDSDCSGVKDPDLLWLVCFSSPKEGKHLTKYVFFLFSLLFPPFIYFLKSRSLRLLWCFPLFTSLVGMEADGSWHDGGIVLTIELMWPRGSCPCMLGLIAKNWKGVSSWNVSGKGPKGTKTWQCMKVDWERFSLSGFSWFR